MGYFVLAIVGFACGGTLVYFLLEWRRKQIANLQQQLDSDSKSFHSLMDLRREELAGAKLKLDQESKNLHTELDSLRKGMQLHLEQQNKLLQEKSNNLIIELQDLYRRQEEFKLTQVAFEKQVITYQELANENHSLKKDLNNLLQKWRKSQHDTTQVQQRQAALAEQIQEFGTRYLRDQEKWIDSALNQNNYATCKQRLSDAIARCRDLGLSVSDAEETRLFTELKAEYELILRAALEREEQARIRAQIREEQKREREVQRAIDQAAREKAMVEAALQQALAAAHGQHSAEVEQLQARLAEAEAKSMRAISQAQLTKSGNVYVITNIGSFGEGVFKIGMTRRLEPQDRIDELGDASVPFPFDVHLMIATDNAPLLENALHRAFHKRRINKVNLRKEFFRVTLEEIIEIVKEHHGEVAYRADAEALQYRNSLKMTDEDLELLEEVYEEEEDEQPTPDEE